MVCRERARRENASIVQVDPVNITSIAGLQVITKSRAGLAASYVGRLTFPLAAPHYLVQMDASEHGITGQRDAIATTVNNGLGMVRNAQKRHDEAIPLLERALRIFEKEHGPRFRDNADVWGNLAMSFAYTGDERRANHARSRAEAILKGAE
jgi:hypothetical protein